MPMLGHPAPPGGWSCGPAVHIVDHRARSVLSIPTYLERMFRQMREMGEVVRRCTMAHQLHVLCSILISPEGASEDGLFEQHQISELAHSARDWRDGSRHPRDALERDIADHRSILTDIDAH